MEDIIQGGNGFRTFQGGQGFGGGYGGMGLNFQRAFGSAAMYQGYGGYGGYQQAASAQGGTYGQGYDYSGYAQQPAFASPGYSGYTAQQGAFTAATGGSAGLTAAAALWRAIQDEQGRTYYYNTQTGQVGRVLFRGRIQSDDVCTSSVPAVEAVILMSLTLNPTLHAVTVGEAPWYVSVRAPSRGRQKTAVGLS